MRKTEESIRYCFTLRGTVVGVGFRPFVQRLARELDLHGYVCNSAQGVTIELEGSAERLREFERRLDSERPAGAVVCSMERSVLDPAGHTGAFEIREGDDDGPVVAPVLPDIAICPECLEDIRNPGDRRYRYPFTNCSHCGPRFSIVTSLPHNRLNTTLRGFDMCERCRAEYDDPDDRHHHAHAIACPECGPWVEWWDASGKCRAVGDVAMRRAADAVGDGRIVALKGLGGFQLLVDARNDAAVARLRRRKHRDEKPFAIMAPSMGWVRAHCDVNDLEARRLLSPEAPITLVRRRGGGGVAESVAPGHPFLGVMLPYTPLHHLLIDDIGGAVVATSGNIAEEPVIVDEHEALERLMGIADMFLVHNRPIARHVGDSVVRVVAGRELVVRRARGYAPLPVPVRGLRAERTLALGARQKNTVALSVTGGVALGQHIGDISSAPALAAMRRSAEDLMTLYASDPDRVACDAHPDYLSTRHAEALSIHPVRVQHHLAHVIACAVENDLHEPFLGVSWYGTGHGDDGSVWGGEFLDVDPASLGEYRRVARLRPFRLPGGDHARREPRRAAMGVLYALFGDDAFDLDTATSRSFSRGELNAVADMLRKGINSPVTSSAGRLFDAVASLAGIRHTTTFEGQAAMELENHAHRCREANSAYAFRVVEPEHGPWIADWSEAVRSIVEERAAGVDTATVADRFHRTAIEMIAEVARRSGAGRVVLSGGCFQNAILLEGVVERLAGIGVRPYWHQRVPTNDGGIALGQVAVAAARRGP